jgi:F0F1-type ATP synthase assembly protein I
MSDTLQAIRKCEQWLRMSVLFISLLVFGLLFTLICDVSRSWSSPYLFFILIISEVLCRIAGIYIVRTYAGELRKSVEESDSIYFINSVSTPTPSTTTTQNP